jgi:hypothetical protein
LEDGRVKERGKMKRQREDHFVRKIADAWKMEE